MRALLYFPAGLPMVRATSGIMVNRNVPPPTHTLRPTFAAAALFAAFPASAQTSDLFGTWQTGDGQARIRVERCGANACGSIVWLRDPVDRMTGRPQVDDKNQDPGKRGRPILGLQILTMRPGANGTWSGPIYNADDGNTYATTITLQSPSMLTVRGCFALMCGDDRWTKVEGERNERRR